MRFTDAYTLLKLAAIRKNSEKNYLAFQSFLGNLVINELKERNVDLSGKILELGCGRGGYSTILNKQSGWFLSSDISLPENIHSENIKFIRLDGSNLPIKKEIFDFIFCSSTIEHVPEPNKLLDECNRILKPTGTLYLTFPPFYSLPGGHKFKPFHYLGEKIAVKMLNKFNKKEVSKVNRKITSYATAYDTHGLYVLKITDVKNLLSKSKFVIKTSWIRLSPINFSKIPILNEFLSWHINFIAKKN